MNKEIPFPVDDSWCGLSSRLGLYCAMLQGQIEKESSDGDLATAKARVRDVCMEIISKLQEDSGRI